MKGEYKAMKKTQEIIGLPIISISDGMEVGKVKSLIINADKGAVDYIVVDSGIQILSARVIPTDNILGVGEYALTIENDNAINDIGKIPAAIDLLQKNIQVKGTKVLTKKGRLIGEIGDIYIDENDCFRITGLEYIADITQKRIRIIPRDSVITFGKNLVVVTDDVENTLLDRATQLGAADKTTAEVEKKNLVNSEESSKLFETDNWSYMKDVANISDTPADQDSFSQDSRAQTYAGDMPPGDNSGGEENLAASIQKLPENNAAALFEQRQRQYLNGRKATKTIVDSSGNVIIAEGMIITDDAIDTAKLHGKLIELVMNNKA